MRLIDKKKAWYPVPNDPDGAEIEITYLTPGEEEDVREKMKQFKQVMRQQPDGSMQPEFVANDGMGDRRYLFITTAVTAWKGFKDEKGEDMPCTDKNKIRQARDWDGFGTFVAECRVDLAKKVKEEREQALGNSGSTSDVS